MSYKPLYDRILVKRDADKETIGNTNLIAAEKHQEKQLEGTVVAVGRGRLTPQGIIPLLVKTGDRVLFGVFGGEAVPEAIGLGKDVMVMREDEVIGYYTPEVG